MLFCCFRVIKLNIVFRVNLMKLFTESRYIPLSTAVLNLWGSGASL